MSFFGSIGHFFASLFGKNGNVAQTVLHDVSSFVSLAEPIVADVQAELKNIPQDSVTAAIEKFLAKYAPDVTQVGGIATQLAALPAANMWQSVASMALSFLAPTGTATSLLNLAIELAYQIFQKKQAAAAIPAPAAPAPAKAA